MNIFISLQKWVDKKLGIEKSEKDVANIKQQASDRVDEVTATVKRAGVLQKQVFQKTTTYYLGRAAGVIH